MANWVDLREIDNNTPFCRAAYNVDYGEGGDYWMSEKPGLNKNWDWGGGTEEDMGYYTYHRWNGSQVTCIFSSVLSDEIVDGYEESTRGEDGFGGKIYYGLAIRDYERDQLPQMEINGSNWYVIDYRDFQGYIPLYRCNYPDIPGLILVDTDMGSIVDAGVGQKYGIATDAGIVKVPMIANAIPHKIITNDQTIYRI